MNKDIISIAVGTPLFCLGVPVTLALCGFITDHVLRFLLGAGVAGVFFCYLNGLQSES